jgi:hypothetical protein
MMSPSHAMLAAIVAMGGLHLVMLIWLYATRFPAMVQANMRAQKAEIPGMLQTLPAWARNPAANYTNLCEAPTVFYAMVVAIVLLGQADTLYAGLAWSYVALRGLHSLVQATVNIVLVRFAIFSLSWVVLGTMIVRCGLSF